MNRRQFLLRIGGTTVAVPAVLVMTSCGGGDGGSPDAREEFSISSSGQDHVHQILIECSDLAGGAAVTYTSTSAEAHTHQVMLTASEVGMIDAGQTVTVMTSDEAHDHTWTISKPSNRC
jgi:hypothetical protein